MEKAYFFIRKADSGAVERIFSGAGVKLCLCPCYDEPETVLVSFYSTPSEQKFLMGRLVDSCISFEAV